MIDKVEILLDTLDLEEIFEVLEITPYEVLTHLLENGLVSLPPFLEEYEDDEVSIENLYGTAEEQASGN